MSENRKLATILSLDVVGYSAAAERDDAAAAEAVRSLRAAVSEIVAPFGGRIFSSAGDGFMLEFPAATAGVLAAAALLEACKSPAGALPQIRIGVHLGEVIVEANGDLLGHGVNVAARLQQRAEPGAMIVSQYVRHSVRGEAAEMLRPLGTIRLDKMSERVAIFGFGSGAMLRRSWRPDRIALLIGAGGVALALVVLAIFTTSQVSTSARTAVFMFSTPSGDEAAHGLAVGIANEINNSISEIGLEPVSRSGPLQGSGGVNIERAAGLGAIYALDGDIVREGQIVRVSVRLDDVATHQTIWAQTFESDSARMGAVRLQVAAAAVSVLRCASQARGERVRLSEASLAVLLRICEVSGDSGSAGRLQLARQLAQSAPRSSLAQGRLAIESANAAQSAPAAMRPQLLMQATEAADIALRLNPRNGPAAAVKAWLLAEHQTRHEHERTVREFLGRNPDSPELNALYASLLREVGRNREAVAYLERVVALEPLSPFRAGALVWGLAMVGRRDEAKALLNRAAERWSEEEEMVWIRFRTLLWFGARDEALHVLADSSWDRETKACWQRVSEGFATNSRAIRRSVASDARRCLDDSPYQLFEVLASLGDVDGAFVVAETRIDLWNTRVYFVPAAREFRHDPRFMPLMQRAGLTEYWLQSGHWPDFCAEPDLPYQCRAEAMRLSRLH